LTYTTLSAPGSCKAQLEHASIVVHHMHANKRRPQGPFCDRQHKNYSHNGITATGGQLAVMHNAALHTTMW
jgi:hypothetical protein